MCVLARSAADENQFLWNRFSFDGHFADPFGQAQRPVFVCEHHARRFHWRLKSVEGGITSRSLQQAARQECLANRGFAYPFTLGSEGKSLNRRLIATRSRIRPARGIDRGVWMLASQ